MDSKTYFTLTLNPVKAADEDLITYQLFEAGAAGVQENLKFQQKDRKYLPELVEQESKELIVYFEETPSANAIEELQNQWPGVQFFLDQFPIKDWLGEWKKQWQPFELVKGHWIVPEWERSQFQSSDPKIFIEPGMAFGTGTHDTTQLASQLLVKLTSEEKITSAIDVGTGSGILAILAHQLGIETLFAYDNDQESLRVFTENLEKNSNPKIEWVESWSQELAGKVQLVIANIIDGVLIELKPQFQKIQADFYLFTGVLAEREAEFVAEMTEAWPLELIERRQQGEWCGFLFRRKV